MTEKPAASPPPEPGRATAADNRRRPALESARRDLELLLSAVAPDLPVAARTLLAGGLHAFAEHGYAATTTRDIASRAGMSPAALYIHYASKEAVLFTASRLGHEQVLHVVENAVRRAGSDPADRVRAFVRAFTAWHAQHHALARVAHDELDALTAEHFAEVAQLRRQIEGLLREVIAHGDANGVFDALDVSATTVAVLSLGIDVSRWFSHATGHTPDEIGELYAQLAVRMLQHTPRPTALPTPTAVPTPTRGRP